ncbi:transcriptional regulator, MarR family [Methylobacterium sp. 4-46]|uniref:MarR family winged helix-turn-helix transcriptional regulator n=1 Tax=unclassified Methylobacterium TaxID=2615210 RepID=UPI000165CB57|nr:MULTISPECIES: MarR family transcriptional regulator [Methylobacterium]ACA18975.1 transcriptional regulator, MarR family [Methylobacterium sp. 4-46]WFT78194.1 MarR family transcriptional regulator [Methylobacterium nodulans]
MSDPASLHLDHQLCFAVYAAAHAFTAAYKPMLEPFGLTYPQYLVLLVLWERDGVNLKEIGRRLQLDAGTLTPLLKRLEASGYVRRQRDPGNERQLRLELTETGRALRDQVSGARAQIVCALGGAEEPIRDLRERLTRIVPMLRGLGVKADSAP